MNLGFYVCPEETAVDAAAAVAFAGASAFAASALLGFAAIPTALAAFVPIFAILRHIDGGAESYILPAFAAAQLSDGTMESDELLLTADLVLDRPANRSSEELLLDDVLARLAPDSRVVRLFDPGRSPNYGQLNIDRHLQFTQSGSNPPDASQALSDALAQLRRSLH